MGDSQPVLQAPPEGGVAADHPAADGVQFLIGPSTGDEFNTAHLRLVPIACWRVDDIRFAFDSSFVVGDSGDDPSDIRLELKDLASLVKAHPGCPLSVFGHADPVGDDNYNKALSGRRATAIYALLIVNTDAAKAVRLWNQIASTENWHSNERETMQAVTGLPAGTADATLFKTYMQTLCPTDLQLDSHADFLARGADAGGKGDYQGCGEFNPLLIFSQDKQTRFDQGKQQNDPAIIGERNDANAVNRRVLVLMFQKNSRVDPTKWPCPRATEGVGGCLKRFFSDGQKRRSTRLPADDRKFNLTHDTFACRFYQRISDQSVCDSLERTPFRIAVILRSNSAGLILYNRPVRVSLNNGLTVTGETDENGLFVANHVPAGDHLLEIEDVEIAVPSMKKEVPPRVTRVPGLIRIP